jgi:beta-glucuronidase
VLSNFSARVVFRSPLMLRRLALPFLALIAFAAVTAPAHADTPTNQTLYQDGPDGRYLVGGEWNFRTPSSSWKDVTVPYAWNATGNTMKDFLPGIGYYRKSFTLPAGGTRRDWVLRFESINYRAYIDFNGHRIGTHQGAFTAFEVRIPHEYLRRGTNVLEVRVDARHKNQLDFPFQGLSSSGKPTAGWWPYAGILREVYLREVDRVDVDTVQILPDLKSPGGAAPVTFKAHAVNVTDQPQRVTLTGTYGSERVTLGTTTLAPHGDATLTGRLVVRNPDLWEPGHPYLYTATVSARVGGTQVRKWTVHSGIRSLRVTSDGTLLLNGKRLNARGFAVHEDWPGDGGAETNAERDQQLAWIEEAGGTMIRSHYPLHPHVYEEADRKGLLVWDEIPYYQVRTTFLMDPKVLKLADQYVRENVLANSNHPSIIVWSIANELNATVGRYQAQLIPYLAKAVRSYDDTRLVGQAFAGYPSTGCQKGYYPLDALGVNLYFGWYTGRLGEIADRTELGNYLDQLHACYPNKALFATEWGAEANRDGPADEKGTFAFQAQWIKDTLAVFDTKPWLAGIMYWTLQEFRITPGWDGSNPYPTPPLHQKAVIQYDGTKKPGYDVLAQGYKAHQQLGG